MRHDVVPRGWTACPAKCKSKALLCRPSVTVACVVELEFSSSFVTRLVSGADCSPTRSQGALIRGHW